MLYDDSLVFMSEDRIDKIRWDAKRLMGFLSTERYMLRAMCCVRFMQVLGFNEVLINWLWQIKHLRGCFMGEDGYAF